MLKVLSNSKGSALIELAVTMPVLFIVSMGGLDLMQVISYHQTVSMLSREAANMAARTCMSDGSVDTACLASVLDQDNSNGLSIKSILPDAQVYLSVYAYKEVGGISVEPDPPISAHYSKNTFVGCKVFPNHTTPSCYTPALVKKDIASLNTDNKQIFIAEVFYAYRPISPGIFINFIPTTIYEATIF